MWASDRWTRPEKLIASAIVALLLLPILLLLGGALALSAGAGRPARRAVQPDAGRVTAPGHAAMTA